MGSAIEEGDHEKTKLLYIAKDHNPHAFNLGWENVNP